MNPTIEGLLDGTSHPVDTNAPEHMQERPLSEEQEMWIEVIKQALRDVSGKDGANLHCVECHLAAPCKCYQVRFHEKQIRKPRPRRRADVSPNFKDYVFVRPNLKFYRATIIEEEDGWFRYKRLNGECDSIHTYRQCASRWLGSTDFETTCDLLALSYEAIRRTIRCGI